jgi:glucose uptake protein
MILPTTYAAAFVLMVISMVCWGSWANLFKIATPLRFELFYWDYTVGILAVVLVLGLTLGSFGSSGPSLFTDLHSARFLNIALAFAAGVIFNVANILLVAAIAVAGMAVAFPVGIGLALVIGVLLNYFITPRGNPYLLFGGVLLVCVAIILDAMAYRRKQVGDATITHRGILLSLLSGIGMGLFYPLVAKSTSGAHHLGPYAVALVFAVGILMCTFAFNYFLMRRPLTESTRLEMGDYLRVPRKVHLLGIVGGLVWGAGTTSNFIASYSTLVGPAIAYAIGQGATMVSALWGVLVWHEFAGSSRTVRIYLVAMFLFFILGLTMVSLAPVWAEKAVVGALTLAR